MHYVNECPLQYVCDVALCPLNGECTDRMRDIRAPEVSTKFVTFLCMTLFAVVKRKIIESVSFEETIHLFSYVRLILWPWLVKFTLVLKKHCYFMQ